LIRRASFDLTGLPPTIGEVDAFLADDSPEAYEKLVDRLLSSHHFGERQARRIASQIASSVSARIHQTDRDTSFCMI